MENSKKYKDIRAGVKILTSGISTYFASQHNLWERKTHRWVAEKTSELLPGGGRQRLVNKIDRDIPLQLLQQLSDEWSIEEGIVESLVLDIRSKVEMLIKEQGDKSALEIVDETIKWLKAKASQLVRVEFEMSLRRLNWLYEDAKEVTIIEFMTRSNYKDVIEYHEELNKILWEMHFEAVEWHEAKILSEVARAMEGLENNIIPRHHQVTDAETYYCRECGAPFHRGDVFCSNPNCGKPITFMDYEN